MGDVKTKIRLVPILLGVAFLFGAIRGGYLLGWPSGILLGVSLAFAAFLMWDAFRSDVRFRLISQDIQYSIDQVANERRMRAELNAVFVNDGRFSSLRPKFTQLKCTNITMTGSLPDSSSLNDVRVAISTNCPTVCEMALVSWNIHLRDSGEQINANDGRMGRDDPIGDDAG